MDKLTRHFYKIEDVCAALQYSIHKKEPYEAVYWYRELDDQNVNIRELLFLSWFHSIGLANLTILDLIDSFNYQRIFQISSCKQRSSILPYMLLNGTLNKTYKTKKTLVKLSKTLSSLSKNNLVLETWMKRVLYSKFLESWQSSLELWDSDEFIPMIQNVVSEKFEQSQKMLEIIIKIYSFNFVNIIYRRCAIIGLLCMNDDTFEEALKPLEPVPYDLNLYIEYFKSVYASRKGRVFALPNECFYGKTTRGRMLKTESNLSELYDSDKLLQKQKIYDDIVRVFGSFEKFKMNDDEYERFYDFYFVDDIPDEWSLPEQQKSHGNGILENGEVFSMKKYFDIWVGNDETFKTIPAEYDALYKDSDVLKKYENSFNLKSIQMALDSV